jgi:hypothetical protein
LVSEKKPAAGKENSSEEVQKMMICEGVRTGKNLQLLGFVSKAYSSASDELWSVATGNSSDTKKEGILNSEAILPQYRGVQITRQSDGCFKLTSPNCNGKVRTNAIKNGNGIRCEACYQALYRLKGHLNSNSPLATRSPSPTPAGCQRLNSTNISHIAKNSEAAAEEIRQLRNKLKTIRRQRIHERARMEMHVGKALELQNPEQVECASKAIEEANKVVVETDVFQNDSDSKELWQYHYEQLSKYAKVGGKKKGLLIDPVILNWCMGLLAKTSNSVYRELQRVFLLPDISWVNKKASERVSTSSTTAHGIHTKTIAALDKSLKKKGEESSSPDQRPGQRLGFLSFDSYQLREGMKWDHQKLTYVGGDDQFSYDVLDRKFRAMAKEAGDSAINSEVSIAPYAWLVLLQWI